MQNMGVVREIVGILQQRNVNFAIQVSHTHRGYFILYTLFYCSFLLFISVEVYDLCPFPFQIYVLNFVDLYLLLVILSLELGPISENAHDYCTSIFLIAEGNPLLCKLPHYFLYEK